MTTTTLQGPQSLTHGKRLDDLYVLARARLPAGLDVRDIGTFLDLVRPVRRHPD